MNKRLFFNSVVGDYIMVDQTICRSIDYLAPEGYDVMVYEVIRMIDHFPLFYDDHVKRLFHSSTLVEKSIDIDRSALLLKLIELSKQNNLAIGNVMLIAVFYKGQYNFIAHFIPHSYPNEYDYVNGVEVGCLHAERMNPEAKVIQPAVRQTANKLIADTGVYEVLLINGKEQITEGSRSNLFFIRENILYTTPLNKVLRGITLLKVIDLAKRLKIEVHFESLLVTDLDSVDSLFISGTSPKILPVHKVNNYLFNVNHPILKDLMLAYEALIKNDIVEKKRLVG